MAYLKFTGMALLTFTGFLWPQFLLGVLIMAASIYGFIVFFNWR